MNHSTLQNSRIAYQSHRLLWDFQQSLVYRSQGLICAPIGTLPQTPQQSSILGIPFVVPNFSTTTDESSYRSQSDCLIECSTSDAVDQFQTAPSSLLLKQTPFRLSPSTLTYKALRSLGYTVVDGLKFGVDWLVYRGEPLTIHSESLVTSISSSSSITPIELISLNRIAAAVKKKAFLAITLTDTLPESYFFSFGLQSPSAIQASRALIPSGSKLALLNIERIKNI